MGPIVLQITVNEVINHQVNFVCHHVFVFLFCIIIYNDVIIML